MSSSVLLCILILLYFEALTHWTFYKCILYICFSLLLKLEKRLTVSKVFYLTDHAVSLFNKWHFQDSFLLLLLKKFGHVPCFSGTARSLFLSSFLLCLSSHKHLVGGWFKEIILTAISSFQTGMKSWPD